MKKKIKKSCDNIEVSNNVVIGISKEMVKTLGKKSIWINNG